MASLFGETCRDGGIHKDHLVAKDSSGNSNDLPLVTPPTRQDVQISQAGTHTHTFFELLTVCLLDHPERLFASCP